MSKLLVGCDPEFFLKDSNTGLYISAHDRVPGTKQEPYKLRNGGHVQADGTAVEFNIPPSSTPKQFKQNIMSALSDIRDEFFKDSPNLKFAFDPVADYRDEYFKSLPLKAKELGCDPDYSAYNLGKANTKPNVNNTFRTGSGHIHVGFLAKEEFVPPNVEPIEDTVHVNDCCTLAIAMDYSLMLYRALWDTDTKRSSMYGQPGCFRPKPYGMEYRTLSNAWLNYPSLWPWLFEATRRAVDLANSDEFVRVLTLQSISNMQIYMGALNNTCITNKGHRSEYQRYVYLNDLSYAGLVLPPPIGSIKNKLVM